MHVAFYTFAFLRIYILLLNQLHSAAQHLNKDEVVVT